MWTWFGLSYASYLVLPRTLLCGLPTDLQEELIDVLDKISNVYDYSKINDNYSVQLRGSNGKFIKDPLANYRHPSELPYSVKK